MGCGESKEEIKLSDHYRNQLKNPSVVGAMQTLLIDQSDLGLRFFRVFSKMDLDGSNSIDLDEFHQFFGLKRTTLSDQVFSALGGQSAQRDVTFDDFILNMWNFCTMSAKDLHQYVFNLYDEDKSGNLDAAECDSLFRLLYHIDELTQELKKILKEIDSDGDGLLSFDEFCVFCDKYRNILRPIFHIQERAQERCLGKSFWKKESKKRAKVLAKDKDIFKMSKKRKIEFAKSVETQNAEAQAARRKTIMELKAPSPEKYKVHTQLSTPNIAKTIPSIDGKRASQSEPPKKKTVAERLAELEQEKERNDLEQWRKEHEKDSEITGYINSYVEKYVVDNELQAKSQRRSSSVEDIQVTTNLRYKAAVALKKLNEAEEQVKKKWEIEEKKMKVESLEEITKVIGGSKALENQEKSNDVTTTISNFMQKRIAESDAQIEASFQIRWDMLKRITQLEAEKKWVETQKESGKQEMALKEEQQVKSTLQTHVKDSTKVLPIEDESWTHAIDPSSGRVYYISTLGYSTWDRPKSYTLGSS